MAVQSLYETDEAQQLRDSARGFLARYWPPDKAFEDASKPEALLELWQRIAAQGWTSLGSDAEAGGLGEALILLEELGRAACPMPLLDSFLATTALRGIDSPAVHELLEALEAGRSAISVAFGPGDGDSKAGSVATVEATDGTMNFSGTVRFVEGLSFTAYLLVAIGSDETTNEMALLRVDAPGVTVTPTPGFAVPPLSEVQLENVPGQLVSLPQSNLRDLAILARLGSVARAYGAASRSFDLAVEHAKVRKQFGELIGHFQAIQHKLANCLISLDATKLLLARSAKAYDTSDPTWHYVAHATCAFANPALRQTILECMHALGGISYMEEHEVPRHFRRVHADLFRFGGVHAAREGLVESLLDDGMTTPDLDLGPEANAFRQEVRDWLAKHWTKEDQEAHHQLPIREQGSDRSFTDALAKQGWLGVSWPRQWGGQERSAFEQLAFEEEMSYQGVPNRTYACGIGIVGPALMAFGSPEQQQRFLPAFLRGEDTFCLGYSEPEAGSDMASLRTSATRDETGWVINGTKIYTTMGDVADYVWLAARTDPDAPVKHAGISVFLVPKNTPGITIRPDIALYGHPACTVFYDNVHVSEDALVGPVNGGWKIITSALASERILMGGIVAEIRASFDQLTTYIAKSEENGSSLRGDPRVRDKIGSLAADLEAARMLLMQSIELVSQGKVPFHQAAMTKVFTSELGERLPEAALELLGTAGTFAPGVPQALLDGTFEYALRDSIYKVIGGGSNEIQRTLIAVRGLGLPR
jgi:alkylation response protein AidB-like acyl-CoA dehydrogenase